MHNLSELSKTVRYLILKSTTAAGSGHPSSSLSATDLMVNLFFSAKGGSASGGGGSFFHANLDQPEFQNNDRLIFSKGHAAPLLYSLYSVAGKISEDELLQLRKFDSPLEGHPTLRFPYTEAATGSLGQGLGVGFGMALSAKYIDKLPYRTYVLMGDSEMAEGAVWETIQLAAHYKTNNLIGIIDVNGLGQRGETLYGRDTKSFEQKLNSFGWNTIVVDGHDHDEISKAFAKATKERTRPTMIIAKTVKGKGVKFIENKNGWHGRALSREECERAIKGLGKVDINLKGVVAAPAQKSAANLHSPIAQINCRYEVGDKIATRFAYGEALKAIFPEHQNMVVLDAETSNSTYAELFKVAYPKRFFEMFIAEQNMVSAALGFSRRGKLPFVSTFAAFFTRAADQIRMSQYSNSSIKFVGSHCGVSIGEDGASQMGLEDIALFRSANCVVLYPSDATSTNRLVAAAANHEGNVYLRTTREKTPVLYKEGEQFPIGGSKTIRKSAEDKATVVAAGITLHEALKAHDILLKEGINIRVIDLYSIQPLDKDTLRKAAEETGNIITVEDHYSAGGIGEAVAALVGELGIKNKELRTIVESLAVRKMPQSGKPAELLAYEEIDASAIVKAVRKYVA
ncbi:MAG: transketolase [Patescibacteria group bacterium]